MMETVLLSFVLALVFPLDFDFAFASALMSWSNLMLVVVAIVSPIIYHSAYFVYCWGCYATNSVVSINT